MRVESNSKEVYMKRNEQTMNAGETTSENLPAGSKDDSWEGREKEASRKALGLLKRKPALGVVLAGGAGFVAANLIGVGELAIAMAAGYAAYRALTS